ncbi:uncharacterized protein LOC100906267 [Galendromus occidentalis]|uniref:Uncharacterized protein LOC100906267 n=1 Tax=Galendromus occidentalis TaxID=34638 RepID=A0AAJ6QU24_9ACAR|nr:uncharacterized protein LOC100906267 [Galendromus occidentalis]XP_018495254.1 uncharacterized protein LOC100906267 [Galendromus occidentalis]
MARSHEFVVLAVSVLAAVWMVGQGMPAGEKPNEASAKEALNGTEAINSTEAASNSGFSCEGRIFGYYGDTKNCSLFHYCEPFTDPEKNQFVLHAAYLCPNETVFNQLSLTCVYPAEALDCSRAPEYYYVNSHVVPVDSSAEQSSSEAGSAESQEKTKDNEASEKKDGKSQ